MACLLSMGASETHEKLCVSYRKHASLAPKRYKCRLLYCKRYGFYNERRAEHLWLADVVLSVCTGGLTGI